MPRRIEYRFVENEKECRELLEVYCHKIDEYLKSGDFEKEFNDINIPLLFNKSIYLSSERILFMDELANKIFKTLKSNKYISGFYEILFCQDLEIAEIDEETNSISYKVQNKIEKNEISKKIDICICEVIFAVMIDFYCMNRDLKNNNYNRGLNIRKPGKPWNLVFYSEYERGFRTKIRNLSTGYKKKSPSVGELFDNEKKFARFINSYIEHFTSTVINTDSSELCAMLNFNLTLMKNITCLIIETNDFSMCENIVFTYLNCIKTINQKTWDDYEKQICVKAITNQICTILSTLYNKSAEHVQPVLELNKKCVLHMIDVANNDAMLFCLKAFIKEIVKSNKLFTDDLNLIPWIEMIFRMQCEKIIANKSISICDKAYFISILNAEPLYNLHPSYINENDDSRVKTIRITKMRELLDSLMAENEYINPNSMIDRKLLDKIRYLKKITLSDVDRIFDYNFIKEVKRIDNLKDAAEIACNSCPKGGYAKIVSNLISLSNCIKDLYEHLENMEEKKNAKETEIAEEIYSLAISIDEDTRRLMSLISCSNIDKHIELVKYIKKIRRYLFLVLNVETPKNIIDDASFYPLGLIAALMSTQSYSEECLEEETLFLKIENAFLRGKFYFSVFNIFDNNEHDIINVVNDMTHSIMSVLQGKLRSAVQCKNSLDKKCPISLCKNSRDPSICIFESKKDCFDFSNEKTASCICYHNDRCPIFKCKIRTKKVKTLIKSTLVMIDKYITDQYKKEEGCAKTAFDDFFGQCGLHRFAVARYLL